MSSILTVEGVVEPWFRNGSNLQGANVPVSARKPQFLASKFKLIYVLTSNSIEIKKRPQTPVLKKSEKCQEKVHETLDFIGFLDDSILWVWFRSGLEADFRATFGRKRAVDFSTAL